MYEKGPRREELIARLRHELELSIIDVSDDELLTRTKDSYLYARIELDMAISEFCKELKSCI